MEGEGVVKGGDGDVATVKDGVGARIGVQASAGIEAAERGLAGGGGTDGTGTKAGT